MDNDFLPMASDSWRKLRRWSLRWEQQVDKTSIVRLAVTPYINFVHRLEKGFSWRHRLYILFTGHLPDDF